MKKNSLFFLNLGSIFSLFSLLSLIILSFKFEASSLPPFFTARLDSATPFAFGAFSPGGDATAAAPAAETTIINSPLELSEMDKLNHLKNIIDLMGINFNISAILAYFLFTLIFVFTVKIIVDSKINIELVLKYPGGSIIHYILSNLINV